MTKPMKSLLGDASREIALKSAAWVAEFLGCSESWVYKAAERGRLPCVRIGTMLRFDPRAVKAYASGANHVVPMRGSGRNEHDISKRVPSPRGED